MGPYFFIHIYSTSMNVRLLRGKTSLCLHQAYSTSRIAGLPTVLTLCRCH
jgi:hypothetical protein